MIQNVLFLCTGNSARSVLAEGILRHRGAGRFNGFSAGSMPTGMPNPHAIATLEKMGIDAGFARSKSWDEFAMAGAPELHVIITVCDNAAGEVCPIWPGKPVTAHWGVEDPAAVTGSEDEKAAAFAKTYAQMSTRIDAMLALSDPANNHEQLAAIGKIDE